ncbi:MAG: fibronectin type III-like domain-contianing protein [Acidobacteriaceae bacterium]|nr:fibronectin type III-like domain-contianing protein [Acidobacteriaceae bacterium]
MNLSARITNASQRDGDEVAQLYLSGSGTVALRGFQRIHLLGGESRTVHFQIEKHELAGKTFFIGGGQPTHAPRS